MSCLHRHSCSSVFLMAHSVNLLAMGGLTVGVWFPARLGILSPRPAVERTQRLPRTPGLISPELEAGDCCMSSAGVGNAHFLYSLRPHEKEVRVVSILKDRPLGMLKVFVTFSLTFQLPSSGWISLGLLCWKALFSSWQCSSRVRGDLHDSTEAESAWVAGKGVRGWWKNSGDRGTGRETGDAGLAPNLVVVLRFFFVPALPLLA
jgi:hypothetical protein